MRSVLVAAAVALAVTIVCTPLAIRFFRAKGVGQEIQIDGPQSHLVKRGTPTMGGIVIIAATILGYAVSHLLGVNQPGRGPTASGLLALFLMVGMGLVGFLDDFVKIFLKRNLGPDHQAEVPRPGCRRGRLRRAGPAVSAVTEVVSDVIQIAVFKTTRKRVFTMAPFHTHVEQASWPEMTVLVRFWSASGLSVAFGMGIVCTEFISAG